MKTLLFPLIMLLKYLYLAIVRVSGSYGASLLFLSLINSLIMLWLGNLIKRYPERESLVQSLMEPKLAEINKEKSPELKHKKTLALYKRYGYHPILALRSAFPLLLQLPFLFAAYHVLSNLGALQAKGFYFVADLSKPDALLWGINLFPILMTAINVITALITPGFGKKDKIQAFIIAALFLLLLYRAASALLIFWTTNNIIFFIRTLFSRRNLSTAIPVRQTQFSFDGFKDFAVKQLSFFRQYFALLCLFYIYQAFAMEEGYVFDKFIKYVPFFIAALGLWITQLIYLIQRHENDIRYILAAAIFAANFVFMFLAIAFIAVTGSAFGLKPNFAYNLLSYLLIMSAFAAGFFMPPTETKVSRIAWYRTLLLILLSSIPAVHYARVNSDYLLGAFKPIFYLSIPLIAFINYWLLYRIAGHDSDKNVSAYRAAFFTAIITILPVIRFSLRSSGNVLMKTGTVDLDFWVLLFVAILFGFFFMKKERLRKLNQIAGIVLLVFVLSGLFYKNDTQKEQKTQMLDSDLQQIVLKEKPNIYLFVYDGIPNERVFNYQGLPFERLNSILKKYDFKLYADTYSLGSVSLSSMGKMLDFSNKLYADGRDTYSGNSRANHILRNNGYQSRFLLGNYYTGYTAFENSDLYEELYPPRSATTAQSDFYLVLMRGIFQGDMRFDTRGLVEVDELDEQGYKLMIIKEDKTSTFVVNHYYCPGHSQNSGQCLPNETELWLEKLEIALDQMERDFAAIVEYDPNSIVIAIGDHGPSLTGDCNNLDAWKKEEITEELIWDRIGTMLAIRWPNTEKAAKYDDHIVINQDVFPVIISYLSDDPKYLSYCPEKIFWGLSNAFRSQIGFDKGKIILEK